MTENKRAKREARERQRVTGEPYTVARRNSDAQGTSGRWFQADHCANCQHPLPPQVEGLFCSELCGQTAETVRYWRRVSRDGRIRQAEVELALRTRVAHLLAGGYRRQARRLTDAVREQVWTDHNGLCARCGRPGQEIDHIDSDSSDLSNLQLLCAGCHQAKTSERMVPASDDQAAMIKALFAERVEPETPTLLCDDDVRWATDWRSLKANRRRRLMDELEAMGYSRDDFPGRSWAEMWDEALDMDNEVEDTGGYSLDDDSGYGPYSYFAHAMAKDD